MARRVMRRTERSFPNQTLSSAMLSRRRVDPCYLDALFQSERRKDRRQPTRQHRLSRARRSHHQNVVPSRRRDLDGADRLLLALYIAIVELIQSVGSGQPGVFENEG